MQKRRGRNEPSQIGVIKWQHQIDTLQVSARVSGGATEDLVVDNLHQLLSDAPRPFSLYRHYSLTANTLDALVEAGKLAVDRWPLLTAGEKISDLNTWLERIVMDRQELKIALIIAGAYERVME